MMNMAPKDLLAILALGCCLVSAPLSAAAQDNSQGTQDLIRSALIYNFCKFVQWPENNSSETIILGVVGDSGRVPDFSSIVGKNVGSVPIEIRIVHSSEDLKDCRLLYIADAQSGSISDTLAAAQAQSILTISDMDDFCTEGGIIQLVERRGKIRFFINRQAADKSQLSLSSQLLKVAKIVEGS